MSMCSCRLFGELGIRSEELGMFVDGGKEFRGFKVSRDFKEGLRVGRGHGWGFLCWCTRAGCPRPGLLSLRFF